MLSFNKNQKKKDVIYSEIETIEDVTKNIKFSCSMVPIDYNFNLYVISNDNRYLLSKFDKYLLRTKYYNSSEYELVVDKNGKEYGRIRLNKENNYKHCYYSDCSSHLNNKFLEMSNLKQASFAKTSRYVNLSEIVFECENKYIELYGGQYSEIFSNYINMENYSLLYSGISNDKFIDNGNYDIYVIKYDGRYHYLINNNIIKDVLPCIPSVIDSRIEGDYIYFAIIPMEFNNRKNLFYENDFYCLSSTNIEDISIKMSQCNNYLKDTFTLKTASSGKVYETKSCSFKDFNLTKIKINNKFGRISNYDNVNIKFGDIIGVYNNPLQIYLANCEKYAKNIKIDNNGNVMSDNEISVYSKYAYIGTSYMFNSVKHSSLQVDLIKCDFYPIKNGYNFKYYDKITSLENLQIEKTNIGNRYLLNLPKLNYDYAILFKCIIGEEKRTRIFPVINLRHTVDIKCNLVDNLMQLQFYISNLYNYEYINSILKMHIIKDGKTQDVRNIECINGVCEKIEVDKNFLFNNDYIRIDNNDETICKIGILLNNEVDLSRKAFEIEWN